MNKTFMHKQTCCTGGVNRPLYALAAAVLFTAAGYDLYLRYQYMLGAPFNQWKPSFFLVSFFFVAVLAVGALCIWRPQALVPLNRLRDRLGAVRWLGVILIGLLTAWFYVFARWSEIFSGGYARTFIFALTILLMTWLSSRGPDKYLGWSALLKVTIIFCSTFSIVYSFQHVLDYPFTLFWSEGNRFWDYSVLYGRRLYIFPADQPFRAYIDIGRQSLWGMIFLLPQVSIMGMRLWDSIIFTIPYIFLGWFIFTPQQGKTGTWLLLGLWAFLFLYQGPIYTPLVLAAILVAASRRMPLLPALLMVGLAAYYARSSRITWTFAPPMWAAVVALVDTTAGLSAKQRWTRALLLGIAGLIGGYFLKDMLPQLLAALQGAPAEEAVLSIEGISSAGGRQPLLWDRLWPNPTNPVGIIPGLLIATLPMVIVIAAFAIQRRWSLDHWQILAIAGSLLAFLGVGLIVSVKIGGGSNLHNMDMFLISLLFVAGLAWNAGAKDWLPQTERHPWWLRFVMLAAIFLPVVQDLRLAQPLVLPGDEQIQQALTEINNAVSEAKTTGDVLFMDHRQLLTFGYVKDVPLVAEWEKKRMMDMAMGEDAGYFKPFYKELAEQRFSLIISEPLQVKYQGGEYHFGNENDAWVKWVSIPVYCYYENKETFQDVGVQLLVPRQEPLNDPKIQCP